MFFFPLDLTKPNQNKEIHQHVKAISHNRRGWKKPLEIIKYNPLLKNVPYSRLHWKTSIWVLNISVEGDSAVSLGSQSAVTLTEEFLLHGCMELPLFQLLPFALSAVAATEMSLSPSM